MRYVITVIIGLALTAALWSGGPVPVFADGHDDVNSPLSKCEPLPPFVAGRSVGQVAIGTPLSMLQQWLGRPQLVENRRVGGRLWTHLLFGNGMDVLGVDNNVFALNLPQISRVRVQYCNTPTAQPYYLPIGYVQQTYGLPSLTYVLNGLQYWLYNALGLLLTLPVGANYVQGLAVYPAGQYCTVAPVLVSFGRVTVTPGSNTAGCQPGDRESH